MRSGRDLARLDCRLVWGRDDPPLADVREVVAPGFELHDLSAPDAMTGPSGYRQYVSAYRSALPDADARVETAVESEDWVFYRRVLAGTHARSFMGVEASGERVEVRLATLARVADGRFVEAWTPGWRELARDLASANGVAPPAGPRLADPSRSDDLGPDTGPFDG